MLQQVMTKPAKPRARPAARKSLSAKPQPAPGRRAAAEPRSYHHGDLRRVLIDAALELTEQGGDEAVSVREAARRAGVSPGAPFRHFPTRTALMTAVAEEAQRRFRAEIEAATAATAASDPLTRLRAFGVGYLRWALRHPAHFEVISNGKYFSHDQSAQVSDDNNELIGRMEQLLAEAFALGQLRAVDLRTAKIAGRAMVYGFARMNIDGHFPRWGIAEAEAEAMAEAIVALFIDGIARTPSAASCG
jgi:AcrR family transcriptional regulator